MSGDPSDAILQRIRQIPEGWVRTYGDVSPGAPRLAGTVLRQTDQVVPWWRVVRADGTLTQGERQRALLDAEGVPFLGAPGHAGRSARVDLRVARLPERVDPA